DFNKAREFLQFLVGGGDDRGALFRRRRERQVRCAVEDGRRALDRIVQEDDLLFVVAAYAQAIQVLQRAAIYALVVDEGAALAADVNQIVIAVLVNDLGVLARDRVRQQLQVVLRLAPYGEDGLVERQEARHAKPVDDF